MDEPAAWWIALLVGLPLLGASAGTLVALGAWHYTPAALAGTFFVAAFLSSGLALQAYRRALGRPELLAGASGGLGVLAFFGAALALGPGVDADPLAALVLLGAAPVAAGAIAAAGASVLAKGVDRYRAEHGMRHAPR